MLQVTFGKPAPSSFYQQLREVLKYPPKDTRPKMNIDEASQTVTIQNWGGRLDTLGRSFVNIVAREHGIKPQFTMLSTTNIST